MRKVKKIMLASLCLALCGTMGSAVAVMASADTASYAAPTGNLIANYGVETDATGYSGNDATVEVSTDYAYEGNSSLKVSGRNAGAWSAYNIDVSGVEFDKWYEYSFYAYTTAESGSDIAAQLSPWSCNADGAWLWTYVTGPWAHINANEWVEISVQFQLTVIDGAMYVKFLDKDGNESNALCQAADGDTAFEGNYTYNFVRMTFNATQGVDIYADAITVAPVVEEEEEPEVVNLIANSGFETDTAGYSGNGATLEASTDYAYEGNSSLKVSGRDTGTWNAYTIDVNGVEFDKWYEYSFYAYTTAESGSDIAAQLSPWSCNADGAWLWTYVTGPWAHINANEWVEISVQFQLTVIDGAMYVKFLDKDGNESNALCQAADGDTAFEGNYTYNFVRMTFNATQGVDIYADNVVVTPVVESTEKPDDTPAIESPKGHAGGTDASLIPGNWLPNATFDNNLFSTSLNNDGVWYYTSPEKAVQNTEYSQDGTDYGCSLQLTNRQKASCSLQVRSLNVWVDSVYEFAGYISASQATKAGFGVNMWAFNENYTDAEPEQRYPWVKWRSETQEVKPGEWTYFSVLLSWKSNDDGTISLLIWERNEESAEIVAEYKTTECTGLSAFEFCFYTDEEDENYLSDLFFDNYTLINVHDSIFNAGDNGDDSGDEGEGGDVVIPGDDSTESSSTAGGNVTTSEQSSKEESTGNALAGCFSTVGGGIAAGVVLLAAAFVCGKKRKE